MATKLAESRSVWPDRLLIDGRLVAGEGTPIAVEDPSTGQIFTTIAGASIGQIHQAIASARATADAGRWAGLSPADRVAAVRRLIAALDVLRDDPHGHLGRRLPLVLERDKFAQHVRGHGQQFQS